MDDLQPTTTYDSYLVRLRRTVRDGEQTCQVTLICLPAQETHYFPDLESLMGCLTNGAVASRTLDSTGDK